MSARITSDLPADTVTREYRMDMQLHLYPSAHLANPAERYLIPLCQENEYYPARHPRDMVAINQLSGSGFCDRCSSCDVADRRERRAAKQRAGSTNDRA